MSPDDDFPTLAQLAREKSRAEPSSLRRKAQLNKLVTDVSGMVVDEAQPIGVGRQGADPGISIALFLLSAC